MAGIDDEIDALIAGAAPTPPQQAAYTTPVPVPPAGDALDAEVDALISGAQAAPPAAQAAATVPEVTTPPPSDRVNVRNAEGQLENIPRALLDTAYENGYRLDASELDTSGAPVQLREQSGEVSAYTPEEAQQKLSQGALVATPGEIETEYGDVGSQLATFGEGALQGASLGTYGAIADNLSDSYRAERAARQVTNPVTNLAGEATGAIGTAVLSGGSGALARGAAATPAGLLARGSEALAAKLSTQLIPRVAANAVGRIGIAAGTAALEGAIDNTTRAVMDDLAAGNYKITAERMMDAALEGAKWGGGFGAGFGAIGEAAGAVSRKLAKNADEAARSASEADQLLAVANTPEARPIEAIDQDLVSARAAMSDALAAGDDIAADEAGATASRLMDEREALAARDLGFKTESQLRAELELPPQDQGALAKLEMRLNKAKNANDAKNMLNGEADNLVKSMTDDLDDLQRFRQNQGDTYLGRQNKRAAVAREVANEGHAIPQEQAVSVIESLQAQVDELRKYTDGSEARYVKDADKTAYRNALKKAEQAVNTAGSMTVDELANPKAIADLFMNLDDYKGDLGALADRTNNKTLQRMFMDVRSINQDAGIWGKNTAEMQTALNAAITRDIRSSRASNARFGLAREQAQEAAGQYKFGELREYDPSKVGSGLKNSAAADAYKDEAILMEGVENSMKRMEVEAKFYGLPEKEAQKLAELRGRVEAFKDKYKNIKALSQKSIDADRIARESSSFDDFLTAMRSNPWTAPIGVTATIVTKGVAAPVLAMAKGAVKAEKSLETAAKRTATNFFSGKPARGFRGGVGITANQIRKEIEQAKELQDPNSEASRNLSMHMRELAADSPELATELESGVRARADYILGKAGPQIDDSDPFTTRPALMDPITRLRVARFIEAAQNIDKVVNRLADGTASAEDIDALRKLRPEMFNRYVNMVKDEMSRAKVPPTPNQRARLHFMLGVPMSREQDPAYMAWLQSIAATGQPDPEGAYEAGEAREKAISGESENLKPAVTPGKSNMDFKADQHYASRVDQISNIGGGG